MILGLATTLILRIKIMRLVITLLRFERYDIGPGHYSDTLLRIKIMRLVITLLRFERYDIGPGHYSDTLLRIKIFDQLALYKILEW